MRAFEVGGEQRERPGDLMRDVWPDYDAYQAKTDRRTPIVVLSAADQAGSHSGGNTAGTGA